MTTRILAFQPWDAGSHRSMRCSIERHGSMLWSFRTLPGRGPRWRLRYSGLAFAADQRHREEEAGEGSSGADVVFATSMLALADLRAALPEKLRSKPHVLYMHENQAAYPVSDRVDPATRDRDSHLAFTNLASIEAADRVLWNSAWNRDSFIEAMQELLTHAPERPTDNWQDRLQRKSVIAPPPIESPTDRTDEQSRDEPSPTGRPEERSSVLHNTSLASYPDAVRVVWPHRWEHDKGCDELLAIAREARIRESQGGPRIHWIILGQNFEQTPASMVHFLEEHRDRIEHAGHLPAPAYRAMLQRADWVLSTARHEFFGMAVAEALLAGCLPWLPDRLSYPELVPAEGLGMNPWKIASGSAGPQEGQTVSLEALRASIRRKLAPAAAVEAVQRIEREIEVAISS